MPWTGCDDDRIILPCYRTFGAAEPQRAIDDTIGNADRRDRSRQHLKPTGRKRPFADGLDLRRDAKPVHIPERSQMPDKAATFRDRQRTPDMATLRPYLIDNRMPAAALSFSLTNSGAHAMQQA